MRALNNLLIHYTDHFYFPAHSLPLTSRSKMFRFIASLAFRFLCLTSSSQAHKKVKRHMHLCYISLFPIQLLSRITTPYNVVCGYQSSKHFYFLHSISLFSSKAETCSIYQRFCRLARGRHFSFPR